MGKVSAEGSRTGKRPPDPETAKAEDSYVKIADRLQAWWSGHDDSTDREFVDPEMEIAVDQGARDSFASWDNTRIRVAEALWGDGHTGPSSQEFEDLTIAPALVDSTKWVLEIGSGLCSATLKFAQDAGARVDSVEPVETLWARGRALIADAPVAGLIRVKRMDFDRFEPEAGFYDLAFSRERLFTTRFKMELIEKLARGLKPEGRFLFFDYMVAPEAEKIPDVQAWLVREPDDVYPWTISEYRTALTQVGFKVAEIFDLSTLLVSEVEMAWRRMLERIEGGAIDRDLINGMVLEGELWKGRIGAMRANGLKLVGVDAVKTAK